MDYLYTLKRSKRKTLAVEVNSAANVIVRAPLRTSHGEIDEFLFQHKDWIEAHIRKALEEREKAESLGTFSEEELKAIVKEAHRTIPLRVEEIARTMGITYNKLSLRKQKTRWGSCNGKGNISLNCLLVKVPREVMDYVIIHELSHRKHMIHSKAFWNFVEKYDPAYREHRMWLRKEGRYLIEMLGK